VRSGREPGDQHARLRIAETGNRAAPIRLVTKRRALLGGDLLAPLDEPRARAARDDLGVQRAQSILGGTGHRGIVRVGFGAVRLRLIVNPIASSVTTRARVSMTQALAAEYDVEVVETGHRGDATKLAREAAEVGIDVVVVLAGDGTLNEAACGLIGTQTALAALPGGSTNVFARTLGIPHDPIEATAQLLRSLAARTFTRIGVGAATQPDGSDRWFLFHLGLGFDAAVVKEMEERWYLKRYLAHPAFTIAAVDTWLRRYDHTTQIRVSTATDVLGTGPYVVVSNADPYTYVLRRRLSISPAAGLDRALAVTILGNLRASLVVRAALSGLATGRFVATAPDITQCADVTRISIDSDRPFQWQVDGDYLGHVDHLDLRYDADSLTIVTP
jgi:diacylglycerol kinase family enzyme